MISNDKPIVNGKRAIIPHLFKNLGGNMIRFVLVVMIGMLMLSGCTVKEFSDGVGDGINDVKRVVRGTNN